MRPAAGTRRGKIELAGPGLRERDELGGGFRRQRWMYHEEIRIRGGQGDRRVVPQRVIRELRIGRHVRRQRADRAEKDGIAVRRRLLRHDRGDDATPARPVVDDDLLSEALGKLLTDLARQNIGRAARSKTDYR